MLVKWKPLGSVINNDSLFSDFFNESFPAPSRGFEPRVDVTENAFLALYIFETTEGAESAPVLMHYPPPQ